MTNEFSDEATVLIGLTNISIFILCIVILGWYAGLLFCCMVIGLPYFLYGICKHDVPDFSGFFFMLFLGYMIAFSSIILLPFTLFDMLTGNDD